MYSFCLHANPEALAPLGNSIVDNPPIHSRPHTKFLSHYGLQTVQIWIWSIIKCGAWCKS